MAPHLEPDIDEFAKSGKVKLPGLGLDLDWTPDDGRFPSAVGEGEYPPFLGPIMTVRETCMMVFVEQITNKPDWNKKVLDEEIVAKWKAEALALDWAQLGVEGGDLNEDMFNYCIQELKDKAKLFETTGMVIVLDGISPAVKSDTAISPELKQALREAAAPLENIPDKDKDWHPGSDGKVLDLVHPSLWPLVYGRSRVLMDRTINLANCLESSGTGDVIPVPDEPHEGDQLYSTKFQWLPCNVDFDVADDGSYKAKIASYINNLHPKEHTALYGVVEQLIAASVPLWQIVWKSVRSQDTATPLSRERIVCTEVTRECKRTDGNTCAYCAPGERPLNEGETEDNRDADEDEEWLGTNHAVSLPDPLPYTSPKLTYVPGEEIEESKEIAISGDDKANDVNALGPFLETDGGLLHFAGNRLQVIVKLASIHLTPEKPSYDGGSWHVEGQLNEHICASALYYYDSENITASHLGFRQCADAEDFGMDIGYEQDDSRGIKLVFGADRDEPAIQFRGQVLTPEGRLLVFPNVLQHCVAPFRLDDETKPGHRKIVALFLVDPATRILSTANVPPQQRHWWATETMGAQGRMGKLPPELANIVVQNMDSVIGLDEAKDLRAELMTERSNLSQQGEEAMGQITWNFCEH